MLIALSLLLISLGIVLYRDRDFWFPDTTDADDQEVIDPAADSPPVQAVAPATSGQQEVATKSPAKKSRQASVPERLLSDAAPANESSDDPPFATVSERTALPPLQVEVVAGDVRKQVRPGSNAVHVELQPGSSEPASDQPALAETSPPRVDRDAAAAPDSAPNLPNNASERVEMSADTAEIVSRPVNPGYPLLARQMKVQGSVILQALIGRDGLIQNLRVISGPPILASAAQEAVKQWHFKPHYQGPEAVETQAKITVNFTISTN